MPTWTWRCSSSTIGSYARPRRLRERNATAKFRAVFRRGVTLAAFVFEAKFRMTATPQQDDRFDVIIIGAGISGIDAAYRITERNPGATYTILERRAQIGGTWDLFRYPGVRSDSSMFTLSFPFEPWTRREGVADGDHIREYLTATARKYGIDRHIEFNSHVRAADWDSSTDTWTVTVEQGGASKTLRGRFVFFASGYYNYDDGYTPEFPGIERFDGTVVHPQRWPDDLDSTAKKIVVIGSGATAVTLIPSLAERAGTVTMLQRSPTYLVSASKYGKVAAVARKLLPRRAAHLVIRMYTALTEAVFVYLSSKAPGLVRWMLRQVAIKNLPDGYDVDIHFRPRYNPWDQRMCLIPDADFYNAVSDGSAAVVTDHIDHFDATGIALESGEHLDADIIVTATGLQLQALGGATISMDGEEIDHRDRFVYKAHMLEDVPNLFWCVGYTKASWTLRADITARATAKLLAHMASHGYTYAYPHRGNEPMDVKPSWDIQANYVKRSGHALPKSGTRRPWNVRQNYLADAIDYRFDRIEESMVFGRVADRAPLVG
jgi:cation diffusion facilitator CzcD-associated flavoprotein CzcO